MSNTKIAGQAILLGALSFCLTIPVGAVETKANGAIEAKIEGMVETMTDIVAESKLNSALNVSLESKPTAIAESNSVADAKPSQDSDAKSATKTEVKSADEKKSTTTVDVGAETKSDAEVKQGQELFRAGKYSEAIPVFDKALSHNPKNKTAYYYRADSKEHLKKIEAAIDDYNEYAALAPADTEVLLRLTGLYQTSGKNNLALSYLSRVIVLTPRDGKLYLRRAGLYDKLNQKEMATQDRFVAKSLGVAVPNTSTAKTVSRTTTKSSRSKKIVQSRRIQSKRTTH